MPGPGCLRFLLALAVMVSHLTRLECGRIAVMIFFYLSGYWVARLWREDFDERRAFRFYARRFARILPLYWVTLAIVLLLRREAPTPQSLTLIGLASAGRDPIGVGWSLDIELQFYLVLPLFAAWLKPKLVPAFIAALLCVVGWWFADRTGIVTLAQYLPPFLFGAWTQNLDWRPSRREAAFSLVTFATFIVAVASWPTASSFLDKTRPDPFDRDLFALLAMLPLLPVVAPTLHMPSTRLDRTLGDLSYGLYLLHYPVIAILGPSKLHAAAASLILALAAYGLVDRPFNRWRRRVFKRKCHCVETDSVMFVQAGGAGGCMSNPPSPAVSVIVPHYNDPIALDLCLTALEAQTMERAQFEIIVADNDSRCGIDAVRAVVRDRARLVSVAEKGAGPARNGGVAAASAPLLAFTDCDCIPAPGWLEAGLAALAKHEIVGGRVIVATRSARGMTPTEAFEAAFAFDFERYITREGFTGSGNLFVARALFDRIGGFRTGVSEDKEWCHRAAMLGHRVAYEPRAVVAHPARQSWRDLKAKWRRIQSESYGLARCTGSGRLRWLVRTWLMPASIVPHAIKLLRHPALPDLPTRIAATGILVRQRLWRFVDGHALLLGWRT